MNLLPVKCLIVDDLDDNLFTMSALLRAPGLEVITARSGPEALERLLEHDDVALALLDVQMPGMDGFELAELIRGSERTRHIPLIFVTAASRERGRLFKGYDAGAVDFLFKPVEPWMLQSKAQVFFDLHRHKQQLALDLRERTETLQLHEMFSAVLAHDLRAPLNAMVTAAALIEHQASTPTLRQAAERIQSGGRTMRRMIADLLDLTRARLGGGITLQRQPVDLRVLVRSVVDLQTTAHPQSSISAVFGGDLDGHWDNDRLAQMLNNLIGNAVQHGMRGAPITVRADGRDPDSVTLAVANSGSIAPHRVAQLFEPFQGGARAREAGADASPGSQGRRGTNDGNNGGNSGGNNSGNNSGKPAGNTGGSESGGLGLGLYIANQIVLMHGGRLTTESPAPDYTEFVAQLPRKAL